jgi:manganese/zinc/iron transport system substrate-binding protein
MKYQPVFRIWVSAVGIYQNALLVVGICLLFVGCSETKSESDKKLIVTTTGMLEEGVSGIVADDFRVVALIGSGTDPHSYKPSASDLKLLRSADIIIYNGLMLEGRMTDIFTALSSEKAVWNFSHGLDSTRFISAGLEVFDPHVWMDPVLWSEGMLNIGKRLDLAYPNGQNTYALRASTYQRALLRLDSSIRLALDTGPASKRILVTSHDAFQYFGRAYQWQTLGLQGISTTGDIGISEIRNMTDFIIQNKIQTVFPEASVSDRNLQALLEACKRRGHILTLGTPLFTDAAGAAGTPEGTYSGMLKFNQETLCREVQRP